MPTVTNLDSLPYPWTVELRNGDLTASCIANVYPWWGTCLTASTFNRASAYDFPSVFIRRMTI